MKEIFRNVLIPVAFNWLNFIVYNMFMLMNYKQEELG